MSSELKYGGMTGVKMLAMTKELPKNRQESPIPMASELQKMAVTLNTRFRWVKFLESP